MKKPEVLAPCGTWDAMEAAVKGGADAVYLGGTRFSARAFAGNFDKEEMLRAIDYCHLYGVSIYMALNTLLKENETAQVRDYMEPYYRAGLDGVIVQDVGVARILRDHFPELPLHASTQMSITSSFGAQFLKDCGFTRIVPARELSLDEIRSIKDSVDIEIETFVHGAMCYAYSGKCLLSSFIGGRSGNRGRCAQPCRQCWGISGREAKYAMSMKDMCLLESLPELMDAGIDSFKIEGRMKKPEYVAFTARAYRETVNMYADGAWDEGRIAELVDGLKDIYNRGGFSTGYYFDQNGRHMLADSRPNHTGLKVGKVTKVNPPDVKVRLSKDVNAGDVLEIRAAENTGAAVELTSAASGKAGAELNLKGKEFRKISPGMSVFRTRNNDLLRRIEKEITSPEKKIKAKALVEAKVGEPLAITIWNGAAKAHVSGSEVSEAQNRPGDVQTITDKMNKTGGTGVELEVSCDISGNAFVQMSELNALRRQALALFKEKVAEQYRR